jgi:7-cyano-7-deazaguanine synthase
MNRRAHFPEADSLAVLVSGGLDSAILLAESASNTGAVHPLYIRCGLYWEEEELRYLHQFLEAIARDGIGPLQILEMPVRDLYGEHWSLTGKDVPDRESPDEAVFLPGRNVLLLSKALLWCHINQVQAVALAPLGSNPFPDASPDFFTRYQNVVNQAVGGKVQVAWPYLELTKVEVLRRGSSLPLEWTFSCIRPTRGRHCGACNKCEERRRAFAAAGLTDPTTYEQ